ncbi:D-amino acid dehydrogenase [Thiolinea disciformis]|uniref:D-amino acid dehydrogenase n=1 Tax=Thiolinea disciformis TaxID=125614 RepID=UPI0003739F54|nr:D-amino acid dehydrogenase [Thiolinea disciformis]
MHVVIIGSGVIGTTTAYYLARLGHQVTVLERQTQSGLETSFANAGQISPGYSAPWAGPGMPLKAMKWLMSEHSPLAIRAEKMDLPMLRFMMRMLANCNVKSYDLNKSRMLRVAEYSRKTIDELRRETGIQYEQRTQGTLQVFRNQKQVEDAKKDTDVLDACQIPYQKLDVEGCIAAEPALKNVREKLAGGLRLPLDETGDCLMFTQVLAKLCEDKGVKFLYGTSVKGLEYQANQITGVETSQGLIQGDQFLCALGSYSPQLLKPLGIDIPVYPVKGYSITVPIISEADAPVSTVMDETYKVAITRLGNRVRVAGTAELTGFDLSLRQDRRETVRFVVSDMFPKAADLLEDNFWTGLRPMTPDGTPVLGKTPYRNLFLNTGHGTLGWTMACGSGKLLADLISGRPPEIDLEGLGMERYRYANKTRFDS